ncbi:MAG: Holliday junction branch migration DNA helicase RuvB [Deltaproteobacteria bacterium]|nr:Holliday junction branch migration DNA helicase RuvB [Deltaproteobacteria bacterium]
MSTDPKNRGGPLDPHGGIDELGLDAALRPSTLDEFVGQNENKENLRIFMQAARERDDPLDHLLLCGPPGLGKTTLAYIVAMEMGTELHRTSGPAIEHKGTLAGLLTRLEKADVLFIDEVHRLQTVVEENLYPAIEDYRLDVMTGDGPHAQSIQLDLKPFTLVGATTRTGLLTAPMRSRFGMTIRLDYYPPEDLQHIVRRSARILAIEVDDAASLEIASRARGTPRIANRLLRRLRDFAQVLADGRITASVAEESLERLHVDTAGLDEMDRRYLRTIIEKFDNGPVGVETLSASLGESRDTLEEVYEPYLLQQGFIQRTPRGRTATRHAYEHLDIPIKSGGQGALF